MIYIAPELASLSDITHGFFGRQDGVSTGVYASLDCGLGSGDSRAKVQANRHLVRQRLGMNDAALCTLYQIHSSAVHIVTTPWGDDGRKEGDGLVTKEPGIALGILTADCAPILFADPSAGVIGAAHAGWKGAISGIIGATVQTMESIGAKRDRITAVIGPCIHQASYEVGDDFYVRFLSENPTFKEFFKPGKPSKHQFDLPGFVRHQLMQECVKNVAILPHDTLADTSAFFSYRDTCLRGKKDYGRQISAIALKK